MSAEAGKNMPAAREVRAHAAQWLERRVSEDWSQKDQAELDAWLSESATHKVAYMRVCAAWNKADRIVVLQKPPFRPAPFSPHKGALSASFRVAAALIVFAAIAMGAVEYFSKPDGTTYVTAIGGQKTITLTDGTRIELNTDTSLRVALKGSQRSVVLDRGEAFFKVTHDTARPFTVTVGNHRVIDLGTEFVVRRNPDGVKVALVEGRAQFERTDGAASKFAVLTPGDIVIATADTFTVTRKPVRELKEALAWRHGALIFFHTSLAQAAEELNRYNAQKIVIADADVAQLKINGTFPANDVRLFGRVAHVVLGVNVENKDGEVVISR
ncbi:MAG TPA: FecR domain-containing protein [Rhizomicrobium sp.]|nr:FecR domain-containing protein [Rhizomicrobium sp.]